MEVKYVECKGVDIKGALGKVSKATNYLQPVFEAVTNALDAIVERDQATSEDIEQLVKIEFHFKEGLFSGARGALDKILITDSGQGLTDENFNRLTMLFDDSRGWLNKGSGRVQFVRFFERTDITSNFEKVVNNQKFVFSRRCSLSSNQKFLDRNSILSYIDEIPVEDSNTKIGTTVVFTNPRQCVDDYVNQSIDDLKNELFTQYLVRFITAQFKDLRIEIAFYINGVEEESRCITSSDFPKAKETKTFIPYKTVKQKGEKYEFITSNKEAESFIINIYRLSDEQVNKNLDFFTSRGERVANIGLHLFKAEESFNGKRFVIAVHSKYIDSRVSDSRNKVEVPTDSDVKKMAKSGSLPILVEDENAFITIEDIRKRVTEACLQMLPEIKDVQQKQQAELQRIVKRFCVSSTTLNAVKSKLPPSVSPYKILKEVYRYEAEQTAKGDEELDIVMKQIEELDPTSSTYNEDLSLLSKQILQKTPIQNQQALSRYIARRQVVLDIMEKSLQRELATQKTGQRNEDEKVLHDILFPQKEKNPLLSDLWILNEEFIHFTGTSDVALKDIDYNGKLLFMPLKEYPEKDAEYLLSDRKDRTKKRPDILLFPEEGKCVIIELKRPDVDLSECLLQPNKYASLIYKYCSSEFTINKFYTFLIGGYINAEDIRLADSNYKESFSFGYLYGTRPIAVNGKPEAEQYMEIHTYSSILQRAKLRNKIFFDLLFKEKEDS